MWRTLVTLVALYHARLLGQVQATAKNLDTATADNESPKPPNKTIEFVNTIKEDLRRNNDDYAERNIFLDTPTSDPPPEVDKSVSQLPSRNRIPLAGPPSRGEVRQTLAPARRQGPLALGPSSGPRIPVRPGPPRVRPPPYVRQYPGRAMANKPLAAPPYRMQQARVPLHVPMNTRRGFNKTDNNDAGRYTHQPPNATQFRSYTHSKHYKKVRVDKLKRLVDKEKKRMRGHSGRAGDDTTTEKSIPEADEAGVIETNPDMLNEGEVTSETSHTASEGTTLSLTDLLTTTEREDPMKDDRELKKMRQHDGHHTPSPSPNQLDMAPARGPAITLIRFKGRLCQRSMLNMEGPTYDRDGSLLMGAYNPELVRGREFDDTTPANPLLPRCCNCCKKSVLGCQ